MDVSSFGRVFIIFGLILVGIGLLFLVGDRIPLFGRLPGDIVIHGENVTVFIPIASMLVLSVLLTVVLNLAGRFFGKG